MRKGTLITFEGPEGSGKSTHIQLLAGYLKKRRFRVRVTREPGGTALANVLRKVLLETGEGLSSLAELFLYEADRAQHVEETLLPALKRGDIVLCDRYTDSTLAYQGDGRGLDKRVIRTLNTIASQKLAPHLTILLDVPAERGLRLAAKKKNGNDRLERAGLAFHKRVRAAYLRQARQEPRRFRMIRQQSDLNETQRLIREAVDRFLWLSR
ncbi:MAG: dTMP kinase [Elusimicrobiota bacterium]|jgi:dTMP kinase